MLEKIVRSAAFSDKDLVFEIGSNSDLVLENTTHGESGRTIERFGKTQKGLLTFPTKFDNDRASAGLAHTAASSCA